MEIAVSPAKVYDLGTVEGREEFFAANPWMEEHKWFQPQSSDAKSSKVDRP